MPTPNPMPDNELDDGWFQIFTAIPEGLTTVAYHYESGGWWIPDPMFNEASLVGATITRLYSQAEVDALVAAYPTPQPATSTPNETGSKVEVPPAGANREQAMVAAREWWIAQRPDIRKYNEFTGSFDAGFLAALPSVSYPTTEEIKKTLAFVITNSALHPEPSHALGRYYAPLIDAATEAVSALLTGQGGE